MKKKTIKLCIVMLFISLFCIFIVTSKTKKSNFDKSLKDITQKELSTIINYNEFEIVEWNYSLASQCEQKNVYKIYGNFVYLNIEQHSYSLTIMFSDLANYKLVEILIDNNKVK